MPKRYEKYLREWSIPLILGVFVAMQMANVDPDLYGKILDWPLPWEGLSFLGHETTLTFWVNDVFMCLFFGIATKEIRESTLPGGTLNPLRAAINPLLATVGGVLGPIFVYGVLVMTIFVASPNLAEISHGWGIPTATDIALAWLFARAIFGVGHPAVNFLLLLAVADDAIGMGIIAVAYPDPAHPVHLEWLGLVVMAMATAYAFSRTKVKDWRLYVLIPGAMSWVGLALAGLHSALALVFVVVFMPHDKRDLGLFVKGVHPTQKHTSTLEAFEHSSKSFVDYGLFFFALANAGVQVKEVTALTGIVFASLLVGKTIGVVSFSLLGQKLGAPLPTGMSTRDLPIVGMIAGVGLTVALFVCGQAFQNGSAFQAPAKMGALLSTLSGPLAFALARTLKVRRN